MPTETKPLRVQLHAYIDPSTKAKIQAMVDKSNPKLSSEGRVVDTAVAKLKSK